MRHVGRCLALLEHVLALLASPHGGFLLMAKHEDALMVYGSILRLVEADPVGLQQVETAKAGAVVRWLSECARLHTCPSTC